MLIITLIIIVLALLSLSIVLIWLYRSNSRLKDNVVELEALIVSLQSNTLTETDQTTNLGSLSGSEKNTMIEAFSKQLLAMDTIFKEQMQKALANAEVQLQQIVIQGKSEQEKTINVLGKQTQEWQEAAEGDIKFRLNNFLENFESNMSQFFINAEQKSLESINLELKSARNLIDSYKAQQLAIVEENIVAILERTLSIVLKEKLNLKDQVDLVYEALEKAKKEKFLE
jgi:hypothetical protein